MPTPDNELRSALRDPRVYLAAERTFLAWMRTGLALMGFGFVVARFGLFLRELYAVRTGEMIAAKGASALFGTALVAMGIALTVGSMWRYVQMLKRLERGDELRKPSRLAIVLATALAAMGTAVCAYLLTAL